MAKQIHYIRGWKKVQDSIRLLVEGTTGVNGTEGFGSKRKIVPPNGG